MIAKLTTDKDLRLTVKVTKLNKDRFTGTVIESSNIIVYPIGYYGTSWDNNQFEFIEETSEIKDSIVESVINQFKQRSEAGIKKYNTTLDRTDLKPNTLMFLNREWDKSKSVDVNEFQKIIHDAFTMGLSQIQKINSDYSEFLKDLYKEIKKQVDFVNSKREEKIELNYKTMSDWMKECQNITYTSRAKIKKIQ